MIDQDDVSVENTTRSIKMMCLSKTQHDVACVSARVKEPQQQHGDGDGLRASFQPVLKGVGHAIRQRMRVTASGCVCRKHNTIDQDDVSVENTT
jgi:hypothetical protein